MTEQERKELAYKMVAAMLHEDDFVKMARAALAVAEPVIREQADNALREENARLMREKDILQNDLDLAERCWADEHDKRLMDVENEIEECALVVERLNGWGSDYGMGGHAEHFAKIIRLRKRAAIREGNHD